MNLNRNISIKGNGSLHSDKGLSNIFILKTIVKLNFLEEFEEHRLDIRKVTYNNEAERTDEETDKTNDEIGNFLIKTPLKMK